MINLLPPRQKEIISQKKTERLILVLGMVGFFASLCLILVLTSIWIYIWGQVEAQEVELQQAQEKMEETDILEFSQKIESANQVFSHLNSFYQQQPDLTQVLNEFSSTLPSGLHLTQLSLNSSIEKGKKDQPHYLFELAASGYSPHRETLVKFKQNLKSHPRFQESKFPPSNWIKAEDIDFSVTLKVTEQ